MKKVCVFGHHALGKQDRPENVGGQTIKTTIVTRELAQQLGEDNVFKIDTCGTFKMISSIFMTFVALWRCENIVILLAHNGTRVIVPILKFGNSFFRRKLHYAVIGGWLPQFLSKRPRLAKALKTFDGIYVETNVMKRALEAQGFANVEFMPNCKYLDALDESELVYSASEPYKLCTFSRVRREKGIELAVDAVKKVNERLGRTVYALDIYGPVDAAQTEWFDALQKTFPDCVTYRGSVPFDKSVETLKDYFALLFPTYYDGEGFAGTLIDAFAAGLPVIASDWRYNTELVDDEIGKIVVAKDVDALVDALLWTRENVDEWQKKKRNCLAKAKMFRPKIALEPLVCRIR